jgi:hypothetical protein
MPRKKEGYSYVSVEVPTVLYGHLTAEAQAQGATVAGIVTEWLARRYKVPLADLPSRGKPGRPAGRPRKEK